MVIVMDMSTGKRLDEPCTYDEEVLNANWMPREALQLGLQSVVEPRRTTPNPEAARNVEAFLRDLYRFQE